MEKEIDLIKLARKHFEIPCDSAKDSMAHAQVTADIAIKFGQFLLGECTHYSLHSGKWFWNRNAYTTQALFTEFLKIL